MSRKLIIFPGKADNVFINSELKYIKKYFDDICLISYPMDKDEFKSLVKMNHIRGYRLKKYILTLEELGLLIKWLSLRHVREEIQNNFRLSLKGIKKTIYILYYGIYNVKTYSILKRETVCRDTCSEIYLYAFWLSRPAYAAAFFNSQHGGVIKKAIARAHRYDLYEERNACGYLPFREFITKKLDEIHFISRDGQKYFERKMSKYDIKRKKALLSTDYLGTVNEHHVKKVLRKKEKTVIASCSYVTEVKRLDLIIEFLSFVQDQGIYWIHIGSGPMFDEIVKLAGEKIPDVQTHFYGQADNNDILDIYIQEDVDYFINLSDSEGLPVSIMEAMSVGIPVIARNVGGVSEIVTNENGCLLQGIGLEDKKRVKKFISARYEDVAAYHKYSVHAIETWKKVFHADENYERFWRNMIAE